MLFTALAFQEHIIEILLIIILKFNVAAFLLLWRRTGQLEDDMNRVEEDFTKLKNRQGHLERSVFGHEYDDTEHGHIVESEQRFNSIEDTLNDMCKKMDQMRESQNLEHRFVKTQLQEIITALSQEQKLDMSEDDLVIDDFLD